VFSNLVGVACTPNVAVAWAPNFGVYIIQTVTNGAPAYGVPAYTKVKDLMTLSAFASNKILVEISSDASTIFAAIHGIGIFRSRNLGASWDSIGPARDYVAIASSGNGKQLVAVVQNEPILIFVE
jgi:hypothetical protein